MKTWLRTVSVLALSAAVCLPLAACGGTSAESLTSDRVTAEEWEAAFDAENFTNFRCDATVTTERETDGETVRVVYTTEYTVDGDKEHVYSRVEYEGGPEEEERESESYYSYSTVSYEYKRDDTDTWIRVLTAGTSGMYARSKLYPMLSTAYEAYEYSEEQRGYVVKTENIPEGYSSVLAMFPGTVWKFKGGKLAAAYTLLGGEDAAPYRKTETGYLFTIGGQSVTLPEA